ncbi:MAG: hypothetical protein R3C05_01070 [Pirellulaceae bacterium]
MHDRTQSGGPTEREIGIDAFPSYDELFQRYRIRKGWDNPENLPLLSQPNHIDSSGREPRYYQQVAINRAVEAGPFSIENQLRNRTGNEKFRSHES